MAFISNFLFNTTKNRAIFFRRHYILRGTVHFAIAIRIHHIHATWYKLKFATITADLMTVQFLNIFIEISIKLRNGVGSTR